MHLWVYLWTLFLHSTDLFVYPCMCAKSLQSCPTLCHPTGCSPRGSSLHGILQTRILKWVTMPSSRGSSWPRDQTRVSYLSCIGKHVLYHKCCLGSPLSNLTSIIIFDYNNLSQILKSSSVSSLFLKFWELFSFAFPYKQAYWFLFFQLLGFRLALYESTG